MATLLYALDSVRGRTLALLYRDKFQKMRALINSSGGIIALLLLMKDHVPSIQYAVVQLQKLKGARRQVFLQGQYRWLIAQKCTFVVHFWKNKKVDHAVCVDGRRLLIWDNEEGYAADLNVNALCLQTELRGKKVDVQVMEMVKEREMKKKKTKPVDVVELD